MSKTDVNLYKFDDWQVLTIDGEIVEQGHRIEIESVVKHLHLEDQGINFKSKFIDEYDYPDYDYLFEDADVESIIEVVESE